MTSLRHKVAKKASTGLY